MDDSDEEYKAQATHFTNKKLGAIQSPEVKKEDPIDEPKANTPNPKDDVPPALIVKESCAPSASENKISHLVNQKAEAYSATPNVIVEVQNVEQRMATTTGESIPQPQRQLAPHSSNERGHAMVENACKQLPLMRKARTSEIPAKGSAIASQAVSGIVARPRSHALRVISSDIIPVEHRHCQPTVQSRTRRRPVNAPTEPRRNGLFDDVQRPISPAVANLAIGDPDDILEFNQRMRVNCVTHIMPTLGSSAPMNDQTTWVDELPDNLNVIPTDNNLLNPIESLLESADRFDATIEPINPMSHEYPEMFTDLRRELAAQDRANEQQRDVRNFSREMVTLPDNNQPDLYPSLAYMSEIQTRPSTAMSRRSRAPLLPPLTKGKISQSEQNTPPAMIVKNTHIPTQTVQGINSSDDWDSMPNPVAASDNALRRSNTSITEDVANANTAYLSSLTPEVLDEMTEEELQTVTNFFYESGPRMKFKETYPFMAEGIVQKDCETNQLKVFSSRLGKVMMEDTRPKKTEDYVYFMAIRPGTIKGCWFDTHPRCLISAKFPSVERIVLRGYAILAHPVGPREDSLKENRWICWNDSLGLMSIISGAARTPLKKQPVWDKQLDVISIHANFENRRFVVTKVVGLTNSREKKQQFPEEVFLVKDAVFVRQAEDDMLFISKTINAPILIRRTLVGDVQIFEEQQFELVVVPTFPKSNYLEFRAILIINMPATFWSRDKEWIRELLVRRTETYRS